MMLLLGILILLGAVLDIVVHAWVGLHVILIGCGLLLVILNFIGNRLSFGKISIGKVIGKNILSLLVLTLTVLFLFGFFTSGSLFAAKDDSNYIVIKAEKTYESDGAEKALAYLEKSVEGREWDREIAFKTGELLDAAGHSENAKAKFAEVFYNNPLDLEARYRYADIVLREKNHSAAIEQLLYNVRIDPSHSDSYMLLGEAYWDMGDHIRGIYYHKLAVNEAPGSIEKRVKLAQAYADMHSYEEADIEYKKALEMASGFEEELLVYNGYDNMKAQKNLDSQAGQNQQAE